MDWFYIVLLYNMDYFIQSYSANITNFTLYLSLDSLDPPDSHHRSLTYSKTSSFLLIVSSKPTLIESWMRD